MPLPQPQDPYDDEERKRLDVDKSALGRRFGGQPLAAPKPIKSSASAPAPAAAPAPATNVGSGAQQQRPGPTNFTNFSRIQSANRDAAQQQASRYAANATQGAERAANSLSALKARFGSAAQAGTVVGPPESAPQYDDEYDPSAPPSSASQYAHEGQYSGPGSLEDTTGITDPVAKAEADKQIQGLYASTLDSQQNLDALGSNEGVQSLVQKQNPNAGLGGSKLSGALIGAAGRKEFDALRSRFNPEADLRKSVDESIKQGSAAEAMSKENSDKWKTLGDETKGREDSARARQTERAEATTKYKAARNSLPAYDQAVNKYGSDINLGPTKTWADYAGYEPKIKEGMVRRWVNGFRQSEIKPKETQYGPQYIPDATTATGLNAEQLQKALNAMDSEEFVRFMGLKTMQEQGEYLKTKYAVL